MSWRNAIVHAAECAALLGQYECVGRLLAAATPSDAQEAARLAEVAAMRAHRCGTRDMRLLAEAADLVRRVAFAARIECLIADAEASVTKGLA